MRALLALSLVVAGCSSVSKPPTGTTGGNGAPGGGGGGGGDGGTSSTSSCSFATSPTPFALPALNDVSASPFTMFTNSETCTVGTSKLDYSLLDMNGDGLPDLVVTSSCDNPSVGPSEWLVYINDGTTGFAAAPIDFPLPPSLPAAGCATVQIIDVTGDFLPDYVETSLCTDATVGTSKWIVYPNIKTGFSQTTGPYALPPGYSAGAFAALSSASDSCANGKDLPAYAFFDVNGDNFADFVLLQSCTDATVGTSAWQVYLGGESGAAQASTSFALPTTPTVTAGAFIATSGAVACTTSVTKPTYSLADIDLDGKVDIVVTQECTDVTVGTSAWLWYKNSGTGFAASAGRIALPNISGAPAGSFASISGAGQCANGAGAPSYLLLDVDGNSVLDLLVTRDCSDSLTGVSYWKVFPYAAGSGFATTALQLTLPAALNASSSSPAGLTEALDCTVPARPAYTAAYLSALPVELVTTAACNDSTVGDSRWLVYAASCK